MPQQGAPYPRQGVPCEGAARQVEPKNLINVGAFDLEEDQVLVVEGRFPPETPYWIFQVEDRWHETVDFRSRRVHLNDATAKQRPDGTFELVVSPTPIDHPNALDTGGRREGFMSFRWVPTGADGAAFPVTARVARRDEIE